MRCFGKACGATDSTMMPGTNSAARRSSTRTHCRLATAISLVINDFNKFHLMWGIVVLNAARLES